MPVRALLTTAPASSATVARSLLISSDTSGLIVIWDVHTRAVIHILRGHSSTVPLSAMLVLAADEVGRTEALLISGSYDGRVRTWGLSTGKELRGPKAGEDGIREETLERTQGTERDGMEDEEAKLTLKGEENQQLKGDEEEDEEEDAQEDENRLNAILTVVNLGGGQIAMGGMGGIIRIWDLSSEYAAFVSPFWTLIYPNLPHSYPKILVFFRSDDPSLFSLIDSGFSTCLRNLTVLRFPMTTWCAHSPASTVNHLIRHPSGLISAGTDGRICLWDMETFNTSSTASSIPPPSLLGSIQAFDHAVTATTLLDAGNDPYIISGGKDGGDADDVCGLDAKVILWKPGRGGDAADGEVGKGENDDKAVARNEVHLLGGPAQAVWRVQSRGQELLVAAMRRGRAVLELWGFEEER